MSASKRTPIWTSVYFLAILLVCTPLLDLVSQVWPLQSGSAVWRYGSLGFLGSNLLTPLLGCTLAAVAAVLAGHRIVLRLLSLATFVAGGVLLAALLLFGLDVLQLRPTVAPEAVGGFQLGAGIAAGKYLAGIVGFALLGWTSRRSARPARAAEPERVAQRPSTAGVLLPDATG